MRLRSHVAAFDLLRELDLLRRGQQLVPASLTQEELQRVGRRLVGGLKRGRGRRLLFLLPLLEHLDAAALELGHEQIRLERVELVQLEDICEIDMADGSRNLGRLQQ